MLISVYRIRDDVTGSSRSRQRLFPPLGAFQLGLHLFLKKKKKTVKSKILRVM